MDPTDRHDLIATRDLRIEGSRRRARVSVYAPTKARGDEWHCSYHVTGMSEPRIAHGVDGVQALGNAMQAVRLHLDGSKLRYTWVGGSAGDHGIPEDIPRGFGLAFARHLSRLVETEIRKLVRRKRGGPRR